MLVFYFLASTLCLLVLIKETYHLVVYSHSSEMAGHVSFADQLKDQTNSDQKGQ